MRYITVQMGPELVHELKELQHSMGLPTTADLVTKALSIMAYVATEQQTGAKVLLVYPPEGINPPRRVALPALKRMFPYAAPTPGEPSKSKGSKSSKSSPK